MILSLVRASDAANDLLLTTLVKLDEGEILQAASPSNGTILGLLQHMLNAESYFLHSAQQQASGQSWPSS